MPKLSEKTVLANFSVSRWNGHRFDKRATTQVHEFNQAEQDTGNYNKRLLPKGANKKLDALVQAARNYHRFNTLPWMDDGVRILPATKYMSYAEAMRSYREEFETEVAEFIRMYPMHVKAAKARLGKLFSEADYPDIKRLPAFFDWQLAILPFPDSGDFRVSEAIPDLDGVKAEMQARMDEVWGNAMADTGERIADVVRHMAERLKAYKPGKEGARASNTFKDSLVSNVRELVELLPAFNLGNDRELARIIGTMKRELCAHDAGALRDDERLRKKVAQSADQILTAVSDFIA